MDYSTAIGRIFIRGGSDNQVADTESNCAECHRATGKWDAILFKNNLHRLNQARSGEQP